MFSFFHKRGFASDVLYALGHCFREASEGNVIIRGLADNVRVPFMYTLARWLVEEGRALDAEELGSAPSTELAMRRCRTWVGVHLAKEAYEWGAVEVPPHIIKNFWKPANEVSNQYLINLRERRPEPMLNAVEEILKKATETAS